jgi:hypothetical protein
MEVADRLDERVLDQILGVLPVAGHPERRSEQGIEVRHAFLAHRLPLTRGRARIRGHEGKVSPRPDLANAIVPAIDSSDR